MKTSMIKKFSYIPCVYLALVVFAFAIPAFPQPEEEEEELIQPRSNPLEDDATKGARIQRGDTGDKHSDSFKGRSQQQMKRQTSPAAGKKGVEMPPHPLGREQGSKQFGHTEKSLSPAMQGESQGSGHIQQQMPGGTGR